jgi:ELWxxDGT repeat protein
VERFSARGENPFSVELWRTDGTPSGTRRAIDLRISAPGSSPLIFPSRGGGALMLAWDGSRRRLWRTRRHAPGDRPAGRPVARSGARQPGRRSPPGRPLQFLPSCFMATSSISTDREAAPSPAWRSPEDRVLFAAWDEAHGAELWSTDGTPGGTKLLRDILPGGASSQPAELTAVGGRVFFSANDGVHGWELWQSDSTPGGTRMVKDLRPGPFVRGPEHPRTKP